MNLRKQSKNDDQASVSDESDYESDDIDQVLAVNEHIIPVAEPYWCADYEFSNSYDDYEFSNSYDDELWLSAVSWAIVANRGEIELSSLHLHLHRLLSFLFRGLPPCLSSGKMPLSAGILRSGSAGLTPTCCQLKGSWLVVQLVLRQWNKHFRHQHQ